MLPGLCGIMAGLGPVFDVVETDNRTTAATSHSNVSFGPQLQGSWIALLAFHGNTGSNPGTTPTATIGGVGATRIRADSSGDGVSLAVGAALFTAQPTGPSGTVAVSWGGLSTTIVVLRVVGYNLASAYAGDDTDSPLVLNIPTDGFLIGAELASNTTTTTWTNLTKRGEDTVFTNKSRSYGWDFPLALQTNRSVSFSPATGGNGGGAEIVASFSKL